MFSYFSVNKNYFISSQICFIITFESILRELSKSFENKQFKSIIKKENKIKFIAFVG